VKDLDKYKAALQEGYLGECIGRELYSLLTKSPHGAIPFQRKILVLLENIEAKTRNMLAALIIETGDVPNPRNAAVVAEAIANTLADKTWKELHAWLLQGSQQGSTVYQKISDSAPNPDDQRISAVLHHVTVVETVYGGEAIGTSNLDLAFDYLTDDRQKII
jgi:hypothetical protein